MNEIVTEQTTLVPLQHKVLLLTMALEATLQGVLITDEDGRVLFHNQYLLHLFSIHETVFEDEKSNWKDALARRLRDPERMERALSQIENQLVLETLDIFELVDGRVLECRSRYQFVEQIETGCRI